MQLVTGFVGLNEIGSALSVGPHELISLVGGGGKTTALFALGKELAGSRVLTTTTKMGSDRTDGLQLLVGPSDAELRSALEREPISLVWSVVDGNRAIGVDATRCDDWFEFVDYVVVEADGSRRHPFKAPARYEPVVAGATTLLVACLGVAAIGQPVGAACHRPELVARLADCGVEDVLTPERAVRVLASVDGSRKGKPAHARFAVLVNQIDDAARSVFEEIGDRLASQQPDTAVVGVAKQDVI